MNAERTMNLHEKVEMYKHKLVAEALDAAGWKMGKAAEKLGITRKSLWELKNRFGIVKPVVATADVHARPTPDMRQPRESRATAKMIRQLDGWTGDAALYELSKPITDRDGLKHKFVIASATLVLGSPETYLFPANAEGKCLDFGELTGSYRGGLSHTKALLGAGFAVVA